MSRGTPKAIKNGRRGTLCKQASQPAAAMSETAHESEDDRRSTMAARRRRRGMKDEHQREKRMQERIVKNRLAAQASRDRKKEYMESMERSRTDLIEENERLARQLEAVEEEHRKLQSQIGLVLQLVKSHLTPLTTLATDLVPAMESTCLPTVEASIT